jgi:hypothetical protein
MGLAMDDELIPLVVAVDRTQGELDDWQAGVQSVWVQLRHGLVSSRADAMVVRRGNFYGRDTLPAPFDRMATGTYRDFDVPKAFWDRVALGSTGWRTGNFEISVGADSIIAFVNVKIASTSVVYVDTISPNRSNEKDFLGTLPKHSNNSDRKHEGAAHKVAKLVRNGSSIADGIRQCQGGVIVDGRQEESIARAIRRSYNLMYNKRGLPLRH